MSKLNQNEVLRGIITWENDLADFRFFPCPYSMNLTRWIKLFQQPHIIFPHIARGRIIMPIIAQRKYVRSLIKKLRAKNLVNKLVA